MWYKNVDSCFFRFVTEHAFDRRTDRQTDTVLVASPHWHSMQSGNKTFLKYLLYLQNEPFNHLNYNCNLQ